MPWSRRESNFLGTSCHIYGNRLFMGDINSLPSESPIKILEQEFQNTYEANNIVVYGPKATFNGFNASDIASK